MATLMLRTFSFARSTKALHWYHWLVLLLSGALTLTAWRITSVQVEQKAKAQFDFQASQIVELVQERMSKYEEALLAGVSALQMFGEPATREDWKVFADAFDVPHHFPGINGIGVIHYVPAEKLAAYLAWQRESFPEYDTHPARHSTEYWPITYVEPIEDNLKAVGLDMAHEANRYNAAKNARELNQATMTAPIILVQDSKQTPGFLFYVPWYSDTVTALFGDEHDGFLGLVYAPFVVNKLMSGTLSDDKRLVDFSIYDGNELLYDGIPDTDDDYTPKFTKQLALSFYDRVWTFNIQSSPLFDSQQSASQPQLILAFGILVDVLLFALFIMLARAKERAELYAQNVTKDLKARTEALEVASNDLQQRNQALQDANRELDQFAYVASHDLKAPLRGVSQLVTWLTEEINDHLTADAAHYSSLLKNRVKRLEKLLDDLLAYSRIGRRQGEIRDFNLDAYGQETLELLSPDKNMQLFSNDQIGTIDTLATPLELIIRNLISNAIKHHDKSVGAIYISGVDEGEHYTFRVEDDGPGIAKEYRERVFELFHTLQPRDEVEGSGLGLSIIKKILELYSCRYHIEDSAHGGCAFVFTWPKNNDVFVRGRSYEQGQI